MSLPNYLTLIRILISPLFLFIYSEYHLFNISLQALPFLLIGLLTISELSDACDGFFARRYNQVTDLGKILDPMADSIYRTSVFLTLTLPPIRLPIVLIFIFLYRDSIISTLRTICALRGFALAARPSGKLKAAIQALAAFVVIFLLFPYSQNQISEETLQLTSTIIVSVAALYTIVSGIDYVYANRFYIARLLTLQKT